MLRQGYLLFELSIVMTLIALMSYGSWVLLSSYDTHLVRYEVERVAMAVRALSRQAVVTGKECALEFVLTDNAYKKNGAIYHLVDAVTFGTCDGVQGPPSSPEVVIGEPCTFVDNCIRAFPDGTLSSGVVYFTDKHKSVAYALSCDVGALAYIRCYVYRVRRWILLA